MVRLAATPITLSETEQTDLEHLIRRRSMPQQIALRAKIILKAGQGKGHGDIARELEISKEMKTVSRMPLDRAHPPPLPANKLHNSMPSPVPRRSSMVAPSVIGRLKNWRTN